MIYAEFQLQKIRSRIPKTRYSIPRAVKFIELWAHALNYHKGNQKKAALYLAVIEAWHCTATEYGFTNVLTRERYLASESELIQIYTQPISVDQFSAKISSAFSVPFDLKQINLRNYRKRTWEAFLSKKKKSPSQKQLLQAINNCVSVTAAKPEYAFRLMCDSPDAVETWLPIERARDLFMFGKIDMNAIIASLDAKTEAHHFGHQLITVPMLFEESYYTYYGIGADQVARYNPVEEESKVNKNHLRDRRIILPAAFAAPMLGYGGVSILAQCLKDPKMIAYLHRYTNFWRQPCNYNRLDELREVYPSEYNCDGGVTQLIPFDYKTPPQHLLARIGRKRAEQARATELRRREQNEKYRIEGEVLDLFKEENPERPFNTRNCPQIDFGDYVLRPVPHYKELKWTGEPQQLKCCIAGNHYALRAAVGEYVFIVALDKRNLMEPVGIGSLIPDRKCWGQIVSRGNNQVAPAVKACYDQYLSRVTDGSIDTGEATDVSSFGADH